MSGFDLEKCAIVPLNDRLLIEVVDPNKKESAIFIPGQSDSPDFPQFGVVRALGPEVDNPSNAADTAKLKVGCYVAFSRHSGVSSGIEMPESKRKFFLLTQKEVQGIIHPNKENAVTETQD